MEQIKKIEERLAVLEEREKSREREVMDLKKEIFDLQRENFSTQKELQKELYSLRSERSALVDRVSQLESEVQDQQTSLRELERVVGAHVDDCKGNQQNVTKKLTTVENQVQDQQTSLKKLERVVGAHVDDCKGNQQNVTKKLTTVENQVKGHGTKLRKLDGSLSTLCDDSNQHQKRTHRQLSEMGNQMKDITQEVFHLTKLRQLFNHMVVKGYSKADSDTQNTTTTTKINDLMQWKDQKMKDDKTVSARHDHQIKNLHTRCDGHDLEITKTQERQKLTTTVVKAKLNTTQDLVDGVRQKLDVCEGVLLDKGWFDEESCCIKPQQDCTMALAWRVYQYGEGKLRAYIQYDGDRGGQHLGMTTYQNDTCNGVWVVSVKKGQKVWIEVERLKGQARVRWCFFTGWVIG